MTAHNPVSSTAIPEVQDFEEAKRILEEYRARYRGVFDEFETLAQQYNTKLEAADKAVRARRVSCGDWELYQQKVTFNADALYDAVGVDKFMEVGGILRTVVTRDLDKAKLKAALSSGAISKEVADAITTTTPTYHSPPKIKT
jgi:hypothetical protein